MKVKRIFIYFIFALIFTFLLISCSTQKIKVALMTNLEKSSEIGESEVLMLKLYFKLNPQSKIQPEIFNDGWDKILVHDAINEVLKKKIKFLITTHTSTVANEIIDIVNNNNILNMVLGATTINLSEKDDHHLRLVNDVEFEQKKIADYVNSLNVKNILLLIDTVNSGYTFLAKKYFIESSNNKNISEIYFNAQDFNIEVLEKSVKSINYDLAYFVVGGGFSKIGTIAQLLYNKNKNIVILFTPWVMNKNLYDLLGDARYSSVFSSFLPPPDQNEKLLFLKNSFFNEYGFYPTIISYKIYEALQILDFAFSNKKYKPDKVKSFLLSQNNIETYLKKVRFNEYGDFISNLFFFKNLSEFYE